MKILLPLFLLLLTTTPHLLKTRQSPLQEVNPTRPLVDDRKFFFARLPNQLEVLFINDPLTKNSQVGLSVNIGSMANPKRIHGLAHLLEHMLFAGSDKYPSRLALSECVSKYQGSSNSKTSAREQLFNFQVTEDGLLECLDIFGNFFLSPQLRQEDILREINTVESEHLNNINTQPRAQYYALKLLINKHHPYSKFFTGNKDTLLREPLHSDINLQKELVAFFSKYYSANIMKLVVISRQSPQYLYEKVAPLFGQIKNMNLNVSQFTPNRRLFRDFQYVVKYVAKKQVKVLNAFFDVPFQKSAYVNKSLAYIFEFLKSNSEKSFRRYLKEHDYIYAFDCYVAETFEDNMIVALEFRLTAQGYKNIEHILQTLYDYLTQISKDDLERELYESLKYEANAQFKFGQKNQDILQILSSFQNYPLQDIFYHDYNYAKFLPIQVLELLQSFDKDKAQYTLGSNRFEFKKHLQQDYFQLRSKFVYNQHKRFHLLYQIIQNPIQVHESEDHTVDFTVPTSNKFIPSSIAKIPQDQKNQPLYYDSRIVREVPTLLFFKDSLKIWHLKVTQFQLPLQMVNLKLSSAQAGLSARHQALNKLLVIYINHIAQENFSEATRLDNIFSIQVTSSLDGITLAFKGHAQFLKGIVSKFLSLVLKGEFTPQEFMFLQSELEQEFYNTNKQQAIVQAFNKLKQNLYNQFFLDSQLKKELSAISLQDVSDYKKTFLSSLFVEAFCSGYIEKTECQSLVDSAVSQITFDPAAPRSVQHLIKNLDHKSFDLVLQNSNKVDNAQAFLLYVQCSEETMYNKVILEMIANKIDQLAFDILNTQKQLGYITFARNLQLNNILGFVIGVQGHAHNVTTYRQEVKHFWTHMLEYFQNIEVDQFFQIKKAYIDSLSQSDPTLELNHVYFWDQISAQSYNFEEKNQKLQLAQSLQLENVLDFIENKFEQGMLNIKVLRNKEFTSQADKQQTKQISLIQSLAYFKKTNPYQ